MDSPRLTRPLYRVAYLANGNDVHTVLVDGRVLMRDRRVLQPFGITYDTPPDQVAAMPAMLRGCVEAQALTLSLIHI